MTNVLSPYWSPWHWRDEDLAYFRRLDPAWINIHQPTAKAIHLAQQAAPNAKVLLRSWDIDDHNGDRKREMYADPKGAAGRHISMWIDKLKELEGELQRNGWAYDESKWFTGLVNEPDPSYVPQVVEYTLEAMRIVGMFRDWHLGVVASSVGTFSKPSENDHGWTQLIPLERPINDGGHILMVHEYWQPEGPRFGEDAGNLAWRHHSIPLNVPILIREAGANGYIYGRHSQNDDAGWRKFMSPEQYAAQVKEYIAGCDQRVRGVCLYMTDFHSDQWWSFDTLPAHQQLLAIASAKPSVPSPFAEKKATVHLPNITSGTPPAQPGQAKPIPVLAHPIQDPAKRIISQRFGANAADYARFGMAGHTGLDFAVPVGTPVQAVDDGVAVEMLNDADGYGVYIKLRHAWGESLYAHLDRYQALIPGATVKRGQVIGLSGNSGNSTGAHLHFAMRVNPYQRGGSYDGYSDPEKYLDAPAVTPSDVMAAIKAAAKEFSLEWQLLASLAWAESSFNPKAESYAGAMGLCQIMPITWDEWAPKIGASAPFHAGDNARVGAAYLAWCIKQANGVPYGLLAYNWGIGNFLSGKAAPKETVEYANKVLHGRDLLKAVGA
jgi:hypothetical protein